MSVQKLIAEADKLLEKEKIPEAIAKLKSAISSEPLNQLAANKLAGIYSDTGDNVAASKVMVNLANKLSEAGKSQVAIAIYKQAMELNSNDIELKIKFATECEQVGKLGDAHNYGQQALKHFLKRKKYFDAANLMPLLARTHSKDESMKFAWVEVMQLSQAEAKLIHLLVALCGPPGLVSQEFSVGGDPTNLSEKLYQALKGLIDWFPRDPKIAYALAWAAQRRGDNQSFYRYLRESIRREPDFCLSHLLLAKALAEQQKLNESLFVYKHVRARMNADRNVDMPTLNRLLDGFVEKNGWISFAEESSEEVSPKNFLDGIKGVKAELGNPEPEKTGQTSSNFSPDKGFLESISETIAAPAEIDLNSKPDSVNEGGVEIQLTGGQTKKIDLSQLQEEPKKTNTPPPAPAAPPKISFVPTPSPATPEKEYSPPKRPDAPPVAAQEINLPDFSTEEDNSIMFTSVSTVAPKAKDAKNENKPSAEIPVANPATPAHVDEPPAKTNSKKLFNPLESTIAAELSSGDDSQVEQSAEKTQMFSPMDLLDVSSQRPSTAKEINTKVTIQSPEGASLKEIAEAAKSSTPPQNSQPEPPSLIAKDDLQKINELEAEGERTIQFSPADAILAAADSRRPFVSGAEVPPKPPAAPPADPMPEAEEQKTEMVAMPPKESIAVNVVPAKLEFPVPGSAASELANSLMSPPTPDSESPTMFVPIGNLFAAQKSAEEVPSEAAPSAAAPEEPKNIAPENEPLAPSPEMLEKSEAFVLPQTFHATLPEQPKLDLSGFESPANIGLAIVPIPDLDAASPSLDAKNEQSQNAADSIDLGEDLLESPTRILSSDLPREHTEHLLKEINIALKDTGKKPALDAKLLLKKADRFQAKRNFYLARKALRHAKALGADENLVSERLREIRKLEFPDGLYAKVSSDQAEGESASDLLDKLEKDFDLLDENGGQDIEQIRGTINSRMKEILNSNDPQTILDFGIGLHEMGLFHEAERLFSLLIERHPESAFDAYYLSALAKFARRDYVGSVSILKRLSNEVGKSEADKVPIYYALGEAFEKLKQTENSSEFFRKVAEIDSNYRNIREKLSE